MGIIDDILAASEDKHATEQFVDRCLDNPPLLHSIAEGLRTGTPPAREACMGVFLRVSERRRDLLGDFINDLLDATRQRSKKLTRSALSALAAAVSANPSAVFAEREHLIDLARAGGPTGLAAVKALGALCASGSNYRGKLVVPIVRLLASDTFPDKELARWLNAAFFAVQGSSDGVKRLERELQPRLERLTETDRVRAEKIIAKLERSIKRKH